MANPGGSFDFACGAMNQFGECLTFLLFVGPGRNLCLGSNSEGDMVVRTCPSLRDRKKRKRVKRRHKLLDRQFINGTGITNQYWTISQFNPIPIDQTQRMLVNAGQSSSQGPNQGCLLRTTAAATGEVLLGDCNQPLSATLSSTFYIPLFGEPKPTPTPVPSADGLSGGAIAGIVIAALATLAGMFGLTYYFVRRDRKRQAAELEAHEAKKKKKKEDAAASAAATRNGAPELHVSGTGVDAVDLAALGSSAALGSNPSIATRSPTPLSSPERSGQYSAPPVPPQPSPQRSRRESRDPKPRSVRDPSRERKRELSRERKREPSRERKVVKPSATAIEVDILDSYSAPAPAQSRRPAGTSATALLFDDYGAPSELGFSDPGVSLSAYGAGSNYGSDQGLLPQNRRTRSGTTASGGRQSGAGYSANGAGYGASANGAGNGSAYDRGSGAGYQPGRINTTTNYQSRSAGYSPSYQNNSPTYSSPPKLGLYESGQPFESTPWDGGGYPLTSLNNVPVVPIEGYQLTPVGSGYSNTTRASGSGYNQQTGYQGNFQGSGGQSGSGRSGGGW